MIDTQWREAVDDRAARLAFERALESHRPEFGEFFLARLLDLKFDFADGACNVAFELRDFMLNPRGSLHGGIIATVMDISMGHLLHHVGDTAATLEMHTQYVKAAKSGVLQCKGELTHRGRTISYLRSTLRDATGDLVAFATATWKRVGDQRN